MRTTGRPRGRLFYTHQEYSPFRLWNAMLSAIVKGYDVIRHLESAPIRVVVSGTSANETRETLS